MESTDEVEVKMLWMSFLYGSVFLGQKYKALQARDYLTDETDVGYVVKRFKLLILV